MNRVRSLRRPWGLTPLLLLLASLAAACSGDGPGDEHGASRRAVDPLMVAGPALRAEPRRLPDLRPAYERLCGAAVNVQNAVVLDIDGDGRRDLILNLWCMHTPVGEDYAGPVSDALVVLAQRSDGGFEDRTREVLGSEAVGLGGVGIDHVVADFNGDGRPDVVFAVNLEDGRRPSGDGALNHRTQNTALLSDGRGGYTVTRFGQAAWNYAVLLKDNAAGTQDLVSLPFGPTEAWAWAGGWRRVEGYDWLSGSASVFLGRPGPGRGSEALFKPVDWPRIGVELWTQVDGAWGRRANDAFPDPVTVPWISWQRGTGTVPMLSIDGRDYVALNVSHMCAWRPSAGRPAGALALFAGSEIVGGYRGGVVDESGGNLVPTLWMRAYDVGDGTISRRALPVRNELREASDYRMRCGDVNGDGHDDVTIHDWRAGTGPVVYLNDGHGGLARVDPRVFPALPADHGARTWVYEDLDGDGVRDLLYWPIAGAWPDYPHEGVRLRLHKGLRRLGALDLLP